MTDLKAEVDQLRVELRRISTKALRAQLDSHDHPNPWQTWTPAYTGITLGNGTEVARYIQMPDKLVIVHYSLTFGSTTSIDSANPSVSLPVAVHSSYEVPGEIIGDSLMRDDDAGSFFGLVRLETASTVSTPLHWVVATYSQPRSLTSTIPHTWEAPDFLSYSARYEGV